jgi:hypothetical protein
MEGDTCCNDVVEKRMDLSTWEGRVTTIVPVPIVMKLPKPKYPFDGLGQDDRLDLAKSDNSATRANDVGSDCGSWSWSWSDNLEAASCEGREVERTSSDLKANLSVPWRLEVALPPLRDCDDCLDWSEFAYDE